MIAYFEPFLGYRRRVPVGNFAPLDPVILDTTKTNYTAVAGETAVLYCAVKNLGTKTVRISQQWQYCLFVAIMCTTDVLIVTKSNKSYSMIHLFSNIFGKEFVKWFMK
jgi:hypothetical protein